MYPDLAYSSTIVQLLNKMIDPRAMRIPNIWNVCQDLREKNINIEDFLANLYFFQR